MYFERIGAYLQRISFLGCNCWKIREIEKFLLIWDPKTYIHEIKVYRPKSEDPPFWPPSLIKLWKKFSIIWHLRVKYFNKSTVKQPQLTKTRRYNSDFLTLSRTISDGGQNGGSSYFGRGTFISCIYVLGTQIKRNFSISRIFQQLHPKKLTRCKYAPIRSKHVFLLVFA